MNLTMASRGKHQQHAPPMPSEIFHQISKNLDPADLKRCRPVCRNFNYAAKISLFREILLRPNILSFTNFCLIAYEPQISKLVKVVCYSAKMLPSGIASYEWLEESCTHYSQLDRYSGVNRELWENTPVQRGGSFRKFEANFRREPYSQNYNLKTQDLTSIFVKLSQLEEMYFDCDEEDLFVKSFENFDQLTSVAPETLTVPESLNGNDFQVAQFTALLKATHTAPRPLKTFKALNVPWNFFQQSKEMLASMTLATNGCQYLAIEIGNGQGEKSGRANLAKLISSSPFLHTLEISHRFHQNLGAGLKLSELFGTGVHWPQLRRLKLQTLDATETGLKKLSTTHATTLRSLELVRIDLHPYQPYGKDCYGPWVDIIVFLQASLSLRNFRLDISLFNTRDERWYPDSCIRGRIERFVVEGGTAHFLSHMIQELSYDWGKHPDYDAFDDPDSTQIAGS